MSINSMNSLFAMAEKMSIPQIQQSIQAGSLPAYVGVPLLEEKMREQKKAAAMAQLAAAQQQAQQYGLPAEKPIAQGVMEQASGIDSMPSNLPVAGYNDGGIVAFAEGGDAEDFDYEEYQDEQEADEYNNVLRAYMEQVEAAGLEGIPIHNTKKVAMGVEKKANGGIIGLNAGGAIRFQSRGLVGDPDVLEQMRTEDPEGYARMMREVPVAPASHANYVAPRLTVEDEVAMNDPMVDLGMGIPTDVRMPSTELNANDSQRSPTTLPTVVVTPERETVNPEVLGSEFGAQGILTPFKAPAGPGGGVDSARGSSNIVSGNTPSQGTVRERPKSAFEDFIANIKEERAALGKQKQDDKYMALLTAGLGMMSGTSPNAFANIGQGAQAGVAQYGASAKQRAAERAALNKNLLMGQRYQSMEDIAGRTADINEARYKDTLAARMAGSGDAASLKQERLFDQREAALARSIQQGQSTVANALKAEFGETGALTNKDEYNKRYKQLVNEYVTPYVVKRNQLDRQRFPDMFPSPSAGSGSGSVMSYVPGKGFVQN